MIAHSNNTQSLIAFLIAFAVLFSANASLLWIDNAHHDVIRHFNATYEHKKRCSQDPQYKWLRDKIARPVAADLECLVFKNVNRHQDFIPWRFLILFLLSVTCTLLVKILIQHSIKFSNALLVAIPLFLLPGATNSLIMVNLANSLTLLLALIAFMTFDSAINKPHEVSLHKNHFNQFKKPLVMAKAVVSFIIILIMMFTYPSLSFFYFIGVMIIAMNNKVANDYACFRVLSHSFFFIFAALITAIASSFYYSNTGDLPIEFTADYTINGIINRALNFLPEIYLPATAILWIIDNTLLQLIIAILFIISLIYLTGSFNHAQNEKFYKNPIIQSRYTRLILILGIFLITYTPVMIKAGGAHPLFRVLYAPMSMVALVLLYTLFAYLENIKNHSIYKLGYFSGYALLLLIYINTSFHINRNTWGMSTELIFTKTSLSSYNQPIKYIHVIKPIDNNMGYGGVESYNDELHRKTIDFSNDIMFYIKSAYEALKLDDKYFIWCNKDSECIEKFSKKSDYILVSHTEYGKEFCKKEHMVIIDYNILVQSTGTGTPDMVNLSTIPICI